MEAKKKRLPACFRLPVEIKRRAQDFASSYITTNQNAIGKLRESRKLRSVVEFGPVLNGSGLSTGIPWTSHVQELADHDTYSLEHLSMDQSVAGKLDEVVVPGGLLSAAEDSDLAFFHELENFLPQHLFMNCCQTPRTGLKPICSFDTMPSFTSWLWGLCSVPWPSAGS
ncbi:hypothetical protein GJ744_008810 [Endocarpon pusillum]|uniref:Uncharacterized protein n=1 Tax=Endocarpon pusillum TaxID=364733 RepID=A0A8H7AV07_9EURO|nr:hypothetical protein GJ744_008810 [Endocarpon pusillum]